MDGKASAKKPVKKMAFSLGEEPGASDSEYESARSRPSTPDCFTGSNGEIVNKKRLRRGTGLPPFRFPQEKIDDDVEEIEENVNRLLNLGERIRLEVGELKHEAHAQQRSATPPDLTPTSSTNFQSPSTHLRSSSLPTLALTIPHHTSPSQDIPPLTDEVINGASNSEDSNLQSLQQSLATIRTHLAGLETAISANISAQLLALTGRSEPPPVLDYFSLPTFRTEKRNRESKCAVLNTVKVACAVERGLEALVMAMEVGSGQEGKHEGTLMDACLKEPNEVGMEMQRAISAMRKVLKSNGENSDH